MSISNEKRLFKLKKLEANMRLARVQASNLRVLMDGPNGMTRVWDKRLTSKLTDAIEFIEEIQARAVELGLVA